MMDTKLYSVLAMRTAKPMEPNDDMMHAALGIAGEAGEFADAVKKVLVYGRQVDRENLIEELGDLLWYINLAVNVLGETFENVMIANIAKLAVRYPDKYSDQLAEDRLDKQVAKNEVSTTLTNGDKDVY